MKIAVMVYDAFCMFELSAALENFALQSISVDFFGEEKKPIVVKKECYVWQNIR